MENIKLADGAQYGYAVLEDNSKQPIAIIPKDILDINKQLNHKQTVSQWFRYLDNIFLTLYWPIKKRGLVFRFSQNDKKILKDIVKRQSLALSNSGNKGKILTIDVKKDDPLKWIKKKVK